MRKILLSAFLLCYLPLMTFASEVDSVKVWKDSVNASYTYQTGVIILQDGIAKVTVPKGYKYLNAKQSNDVLTNLWGNPPSESSMGMLFPEASGPADAESWAIDITYSEDGFVKDDDAKDIKYDELLKDMQTDTDAENEARLESGYAPIKLIGWAVAPFYDAETKKLHWAKELQFGQEASGVNTLNYNIRILGRKGYLMLNAIGDMTMLEGIQKDIPALLASVEFKEGNRYADFDPSLDKVASYGIGGLIAGKVLAKVGFFAIVANFFKVILVGALKFWKLIALALVGLFSGIRKFLGRKKDEETPEATDDSGRGEDENQPLEPVADTVEEPSAELEMDTKA